MTEKIPLPKWILWVRSARAILGVIVLGLCGYTLQILAMQQAGFNLFVGLFTVLVTVYLFVSEIAMPAIYNKWAHMGLEIVTLIFWLAGFASLAALAGNVDACLDMIDNGTATSCVATRYKRSLERRKSWDYETAREWYAVLAAAAGLGALCFVLSIAILSIFILAMRRQKGDPAAGTPGAAEAAYPLQSTQNVPEKFDQNTSYASPAQPYPPQSTTPAPQYQATQQYPPQPYAPQAQQPQWTPTPPSSPPPQQAYPQPQMQSMYPPQGQHQAYPPQPMHPQHTGTTYSELGNNPAMPPGRTELGDSRQ